MANQHPKLLIGLCPLLIAITVCAAWAIARSVGDTGVVGNQATAQDLTSITNSLLSYGNQHSSLPSKLSALHLKRLHNKLDDYRYSTLPVNDDGPPGNCESENKASCQSGGFTLCAIFAVKGKSFSEDEPGSAPGIFAYHRQGLQCYKYTFGSYGGEGSGFTPVLNSGEKYLPVLVRTGNTDFAQYAGAVYASYAAQANLLGMAPSGQDLAKLCTQVDGRTNVPNQKVYQCTIDIDKKLVTHSSESSLHTLLEKSVTLAKSQGYTDAGIVSGCDSTDCTYLASSIDGYCSLSVDYSSALNPPDYTISYSLMCDSIPKTTGIPSGFSIKSNTDQVGGADLLAQFNGYYQAQTQVLGISSIPKYSYCTAVPADIPADENSPLPDQSTYACSVTTVATNGTQASASVTHDISSGRALMQRYVAELNREGFADRGPDTDKLSDPTGPLFSYTGSIGQTHYCAASVSYYPDWGTGALVENDLIFALSCNANLAAVPVGFTLTTTNSWGN